MSAGPSRGISSAGLLVHCGYYSAYQVLVHQGPMSSISSVHCGTTQQSSSRLSRSPGHPVSRRIAASIVVAIGHWRLACRTCTRSFLSDIDCHYLDRLGRTLYLSPPHLAPIPSSYTFGITATECSSLFLHRTPGDSSS